MSTGLLPDGIEEVLPESAALLEQLRRQMLDHFVSHGYTLVMPPMIEYLDDLLTGTGHALDLQTFKITDQLTGKMMGIRADITPQVARIDAMQLQDTHTTRLCYCGTVLQTRAMGFSRSRSPLQTGAELYGYQGLAGDLEIIQLMLSSLTLVRVQGLHLDIGHVGIFKAWAKTAGLDKAEELALFEQLQRKARPEIIQWAANRLTRTQAEQLLALVDLDGGADILDQARRLFADVPDILQAVRELDELTAQLQQTFPDLPLHFDLTELRGYAYHTGVVFTVFSAQGHELARGGRYDNIAASFGRKRPAVGFSIDLKTLLEHVTQQSWQSPVVAPVVEPDQQSDLQQAVQALRQQGQPVVQALDQAEYDHAFRRLVKDNHCWQIASTQST